MDRFYSVYDADGAPFRRVDEEEAERLLDSGAAFIEPKKKRVILRLTVDHSAAETILAPRYSLGRQGSRTFRREYLENERRSVIYQHHEGRCLAYGEAVA